MVSQAVAPLRVDAFEVYTHDTLTTMGSRSMHVTSVRISMTNLDRSANCLFLTIPCQARPVFINPLYGADDVMDCVVDTIRDVASDEPLPQSSAKGLYIPLSIQSPEQILHDMMNYSMLQPRNTARLQAIISMLKSGYSDHSIIAIAFDGSITMDEPLIFSYVPDNDDLLFAPGIGPIHVQGFDVNDVDVTVGFSVEESQSGEEVHYRPYGHLANEIWAPRRVCGFTDSSKANRSSSYSVARDDIMMGLCGTELQAALIS